MSILCRFRVIARFSSKVTNFNPHTCICRPRRGWSLSNFAMIFGVRKLKSRAIVRRYLRDPTFSRFDTIPECDRQTHTHTHTDRQTHRHTTTANTALSIASRGNNSKMPLQCSCIDMQTHTFDFLPQAQILKYWLHTYDPSLFISSFPDQIFS